LDFVGNIWFKDDDRLSLRICSENSTAPPRITPNNDCCACGEARYRMTFYGLWSPTSHPRDYPGKLTKNSTDILQF